MTNVVAHFDAATAPFEKGVKRLDGRLARFQSDVDKRLRDFDKRFEMSGRAVQNFARALQAALAGAGVNELRKLSEAWRAVERDLQSVGETSAAAAQSMVDLAIRLRANLGSVSSTVKKFTIATGADISTSERRVETLIKLLSVSGASAAQRESVFTQLPQALQAGVLNGDEFRSVRENAPAEFLDELARVAGVARNELNKMAEAQKLSADLVIEALDNLGAFADQRFAELAISGEEAFAVLETGAASFIGRVDSALGTGAAFNALIEGFGQVLAEGGEAADGVADALLALMQVLLAVGGARVLQGLRSVVIAQSQMRQEAASLAAQEKRASAQRLQELAGRHVAETRKLEALRLEARALERTDKQRARAVKRAASSEARLVKLRSQMAQATAQTAAATNAAAAAQARLSTAARASALSMSALRGAMAFVGGPMGLLVLGIASGFALIDANARRAARQIQRLSEPTARIDEAYAGLEETVDQYARAIARTGAAETEASKKIIEALRRQYQARKANAQLQYEQEKRDQAARAAQIKALSEEEARLRKGPGERVRARGRFGQTAEMRRARLEQIELQRAGLAEAQADAAVQIASFEARPSFETLEDALAHRRAAQKPQAQAPDETAALEAQTQASKGLTRAKADLRQETQRTEPLRHWADQMRQAQAVIAQTQTEEERLAAKKRALLELLPAITDEIRRQAEARGEHLSKIEAEARAMEVVATASKQAEDATEAAAAAKRAAQERSDIFRGMAQDLLSAAKGARSFEDGLSRIADRLSQMLLDDALNLLLGSVFGRGSGGGGGGGIFNAIFAGGFAFGGLVGGRGGPTEDANLVRVSRGEFITRTSAAKRYLPTLQAINRGAPPDEVAQSLLRSPSFAAGGLVGPPSLAPLSPPPQLPAQIQMSAPQISTSFEVVIHAQPQDDLKQAGQQAGAAIEAQFHAYLLRQMRPGGALAQLKTGASLA